MARFFQPKQQATLNTKHQLVQVERLDHQGAGIAYQGRKPIFIEGALPNEQVIIQWVENKSKYARARLIQVKTPSALRESPFCPDYHTCGGCNLQHLNHQEQVRYKQHALLQLMDKIAGQSITLSPAVTDFAQGYRRRARLSLKWHAKQKTLAFGFRQKQSDTIVNISHCAVLDPILDQLLVPMRGLFSQFSHPEKLGHVELVAAEQGAVMMLRCLGQLATSDRALLEAFAQAQGLMLYLMPESDQLEHLAGSEPRYCEVGVDLAFQPNHFIQVNRNVNHKMVQQALEWLALQPNDHVLDLFCGIGNFSLPIARQVKRVVGVEGVGDMVVQAQKNAALNQLSNAVFYQANLEKSLTENEWAAEKFTKVLLDPARAGAKGVIDFIGALGADRVVYVSCDPATLARDSQSILAQGYRLEKLGMLDMFPHTSHLESMALFVRSDL